MFGLLVASMLVVSAIRPVEYSYQSPVATFLRDDTFVICNYCQKREDLKLVEAKKQPPQFIAIRVSEPIQEVPATSTTKDTTTNITASDTLLESVYFRFGSHVLSNTEKKKLLGLKVNADSSVIVKGYACEVGSSDYNYALSTKRAMTVADFLQKRGVKVSSVEGKGELIGVNPKNRKVDIILP